jgi:hypothetical protein
MTPTNPSAQPVPEPSPHPPTPPTATPVNPRCGCRQHPCSRTRYGADSSRYPRSRFRFRFRNPSSKRVVLTNDESFSVHRILTQYGVPSLNRHVTYMVQLAAWSSARHLMNSRFRVHGLNLLPCNLSSFELLVTNESDEGLLSHKTFGTSVPRSSGIYF